MVKPTETAINCPADAKVTPDKLPDPPKGISLDAVMSALGKDGWQWLWDYKQSSDENYSQLTKINTRCKNDH